MNFLATALALVKLWKDLSKETVKPYKVNDKLVNQGFDLKHGTSIRSFNMDKVSNGPFIEARFFLYMVRAACDLLLQKEFDRLVKVYAAEDAKLPTKLHLEQKVAQLQKLVSQPVTEVCWSDASPCSPCLIFHLRVTSVQCSNAGTRCKTISPRGCLHLNDPA